MKILLVDDNDELREFLAQSLREIDIETVTAGDVAAALSLAGADKFDAFVVDSFLGEDDGLQLASQLAAPAKGTKGAPVLLMSTISTALARRMASAAGCTEFLVKPFGLTQFAETVRGLTRNQK